MNRTNTKMKLLALAILGLGGIAVAGSAAAACPSTPDAWTGTQVAEGAISIGSPGLGGTSCLLNSTINSGAGPFAIAAVHDASPSSEPRYRAQFMIDLDGMTSPGFDTSAQIFSANSSAYPLRFSIFGDGTNWYLGYFLGSTISGSQQLAAGANHVEFDLQIGSSGSLTLWVNNSTEGSPTVPAISVNNSTMVGINDAYMGLSAPSTGFVSNYGGTAAQFDQFDSRRQTFIGDF